MGKINFIKSVGGAAIKGISKILNKGTVTGLKHPVINRLKVKKDLKGRRTDRDAVVALSLIHISEPTRLRRISYAVFCLKQK